MEKNQISLEEVPGGQHQTERYTFYLWCCVLWIIVSVSLDRRIIRHVESADEQGFPGTSAQSLIYFNF